MAPASPIPHASPSAERVFAEAGLSERELDAVAPSLPALRLRLRRPRWV